MDTSKDYFTALLLTYGHVQTSPRHAATLNKQPMMVWGGDQASRAGYQVILTGYAQYVASVEERRPTVDRLLKLLESLRSTPRPLAAKVLKNSVSTYSYDNGDFRADYKIANGQVIVYNIEPVSRLQRQRDRQEAVALYRVKRDSQGVWQLGSKVDTIATAHAAVNGQLNNLTKATWLMGAHLEHEFKSLQEFTLFHNPSESFMEDTWESFRDKMGVTTPTTRKFARALQDAQVRGNATKWVAHSQGGIIFAEGVRYLLNGSSSWSLNKLSLNGIRNSNKGELLDKHSISFHGNANNNFRTRVLMQRAGVKVISIRANDYDLVSNIVGANTLNLIKLLGSVVYANHVFFGSVYQSPHTLPQTQSSWEKYMDNGPGRGRNGLQRAFDTVGGKLKKVRPRSNYLP